MNLKVLGCAAVLAALAAPASMASTPTARDWGATAADFDGDGKADLSLKFDGGTWRIDFAANGFGAWDWAGSGYGAWDARPVPADYDGDGKADLAVKTDSGHWMIDGSRDGFVGWNAIYPGYGDVHSRPVPADYDGDGRADLSVKTDAGGWLIDYARDGFGAWNVILSAYGPEGSRPVPADYDGDRRADLSVKTDWGEWLIDYALDGFGSWNAVYTAYGPQTSRPLPADYDGDGRADLSVKSDAGEWFIDFARDGFGTWNVRYTAYGPESFRGLPADYDGDRKAELAVKQDCGRYYLDFAADGFGAWNTSVATASVHDNQRVVTSRAQLKDALTTDFVGTILVQPVFGIMDLTGERDLPLRSCVWLRGRREKTAPAPFLFTNDDDSYPEAPGNGYSLFVVDGNWVRVEGLKIVGPQAGRRSVDVPVINGIFVSVDAANQRGFNLVVTNNEMSEWPGAAVNIQGTVFVERPWEVPPSQPVLNKDTPGLPRVSGNFLHHNSRDGRGYGVVVNSGGYAYIEGNVFDFNRHAVASDGRPNTGYLAFHNLVLQGGYRQDGTVYSFYNQHFDVHGRGEGGYGLEAGEYYEIAYNTIRGEQNYNFLGVKTRPALMLRGRTVLGTHFHDNVAVHDDLDEAVSLKMDHGDTGIGEDHEEFNFHASANAFDAERWLDMGVGDFDADGKDDLLMATGKQWWYSSSGVADWRFLMGASERIRDLRFGEFDGLPGADVFVKAGNVWYFASSGRVWWQVLRSDTTPMTDLLFGDFDGSGKTDVLRTNGTSWYISREARGPWEWINTSEYRAPSLRVGDFDGDGRADVFSLANSDWSYSLGAASRWTRLNGQISSNLAELVFQDFNGDGRTDIGRSTNTNWQYSRSGQTGWLVLATPSSVYLPMTDVFFGDFMHDGKADGLRFSRRQEPHAVVTGSRLVGWRGLGDLSWFEYSWHDMR